MKSKLTESHHIDICKAINLLNKKWGDKNPPQTTQLWRTVAEAPQKKQSWRKSWKAKNCWTIVKLWRRKKSFKTKRDANETAAHVWTVTLNVWYKLERWESIGKFGLKIASQVAAQWLTYPTGIIIKPSKSQETRTNANQIAAQWLTRSTGIKTEWIRLGTNN